MNTMEEVSTATASQLVAFYNEKTGKDIKKFVDRKTAIARVAALLPVARPQPAQKKQPSGTTISEAVRKTWADPEVAAARRLRHGVRVRGVTYRSVREAFRALKLPDQKHIAFRLLLKSKGRQTFKHGDTDYIFNLIKNDEQDGGGEPDGGEETQQVAEK